MKKLTTALVLTAGLALASVALAHEGHHHEAMGTIEAITETQLTLKTVQGEDESFTLTEKTTFLRGETTSTKEDVATGERAVVMYKVEGGSQVAIEIKLTPKAD